MTDIRDAEHVRCDCVPDLGPPHCHLCSKNGPVIEWPCPRIDSDEGADCGA